MGSKYSVRMLTGGLSWIASSRSRLLAIFTVSVAGLLLRVDALVSRYGVVPLGAALERLQYVLARLGHNLQNGRLSWPPIAQRSGDPLAYLNNARAMSWFYEGRGREPVFNYTTKVWLRLTNNADVAVSAASTLFSVLCVPATYVLGSLAFGPAEGLIAAVVIAIEPEMIDWGVQGWRDDTFTFFFLAFCSACLMFRAKSSVGRATWLAGAASLTLLTRLTAVSFIAPALVLLVWNARGRADQSVRLRRLALAIVATIVLVSPYLINCWIRFGDPLVAINRNTDFYRARGGERVTGRENVGTYLATMALAHPVATADTAFEGMTTYPFLNKFRRLERWNAWLARALPILAVIGLLQWLSHPEGRWLLLLLGSSLIPYAFTWPIRGGGEWRFTMHAYPIYLIAAGHCASSGGRLAWQALRGGIHFERRSVVRIAGSTGAAMAIAAAVWLLPYPRYWEAVALDKTAVLTPGWRDLAFFRRDWFSSAGPDGAESRTSRGATARIWVPLVPGHAYHAVAVTAPAVSMPGLPLYSSCLRQWPERDVGPSPLRPIRGIRLRSPST